MADTLRRRINKFSPTSHPKRWNKLPDYLLGYAKITVKLSFIIERHRTNTVCILKGDEIKVFFLHRDSSFCFMIHRRSTVYLRPRDKYLQFFLHREILQVLATFHFLLKKQKIIVSHKKMRNVSLGTSANRVISLPHSRCILYSLCLPVPHFSQLSVNLTENIFQIWSKSVGYEKLSGRFEPIINRYIWEWITVINICPSISKFLLLHKGTVLVWLYKF